MQLINAALCFPHFSKSIGVVPVLVGPLNALITALVVAVPGIAIAVAALMVRLVKPQTWKRLFVFMWSQKVAVLVTFVIFAAVICGLTAGVVYGYRAIFPKGPNADSKLLGSDQAWLAYRGGADRRAFSSFDFTHNKELADPAHGNINWTFTDGSIQTFYSSPAVVGNRVYTVGSNYGISDTGGIYSLDADTGKVVWEFHGDKYRSTFSSPAIWGKYLVVGEGLHETKDSRIFCIDIEASEKKHEGVKLWDYRTTSHMESSPCIDTVNRTAIVGGADDGVYCFKLDPDASGHAQKVWQLPGKDYPDCEGSPVVVGDKLYFGLGREVHAMCCADAKTGDPIWRVPTPFSTASPAVANGKLYFGMGVGDFVNSAADLRAQKEKELQDQHKSPAEIKAARDELPDAGQVWCIDIKTHNVDWKYNAGETILGTPAVDGDRVYFGDYKGNITCVSTEGPDKLLRTFNTHEPIVGGPAIGNQYVYVATLNGTLYALDKMSMARVWRVVLNHNTFSSPTVADGHVYVGMGVVAGDGGFVSIGVPGSDLAGPIWPGEMAGLAGSMDASPITAIGNYAWSSEAAADDDDDAAPVNVVLSPPAAIGNAFYVGVQRKDSTGVAAFACGDDLDKKPAALWFAAAKLPVTISPAANDRCVFFVDGKIGDTGRALHCVDRKTGSQLWSRPVESTASGRFIITETELYIADSASHVSCLNIGRDAPSAAASELWQANIGDSFGAPAAGEGLIAFAVQTPPQLIVLDAKADRTLWSQNLSAPSQTSPVISHDRVWIGDSAGLHGYSLLLKVPAITLNCGSITSPISATADRLAVVTAAGELFTVNPDTGVAAAPIKDAIPTVPPILMDNFLLYYTTGALNRVNLNTGETTLWSKVAATWPGTITTPMIMVNSHLLFGTDKRGFVCMKPKKG